jgi:hypothetical protein
MAQKATVGRIVHFYDPRITKRIGWNQGYGGRGEGPYAALVTNDIGDTGLTLWVFPPDVAAQAVKGILHKDEAAPGNPYWVWPTVTPAEKPAAPKR